MSLFELKMPKMGESISEATIINWLKQEGDTIEAEETILEVATDKVDSEVPSPVSGVIQAIYFQAEAIVEVGKVLALIGYYMNGLFDALLTDMITIELIIIFIVIDFWLTKNVNGRKMLGLRWSFGEDEYGV